VKSGDENSLMMMMMFVAVTRPTQLVRSHSVLTSSFGSGAGGGNVGGANKSPANQWATTRTATSGTRMRDSRRVLVSSTGARISRTGSPPTTDRLTFNSQRIHHGWPPIYY